MNNKPILGIVVPCYNEEDVLPDTAEKLSVKLKQLKTDGLISEESRVFFVDDGSKDNTWNIIKKYNKDIPSFCGGIKLSRNRGHQNALLCGLLTVKDIVNITVSIDADLQHDIEAIDEMLIKYNEGFEIVLGVRSARKTDSFLKRITAQGFYHFMQSSGVDILKNHADFRLMGKNALGALAEYSEVNLFLRGIIPLLGFKTEIIYFNEKLRLAGESKYPLKKMLQFALDGITSFSIKPIRFITMLGILVFTISIAIMIYYFFVYFTGQTVPGWASIVCSLWGI